MKDALITAAANLVSLACISAAGYLATHGKVGWGWFLLAGICCAVFPTTKGK